MTVARVLLTLAFCLLLISVGGCSILKVSYNKAPELIYWWLDGYLNFQEAQKPEIRHALVKLHDWHYRHELPEYLRLLQRMRELAATDVDAAQVCEIVQDIRQFGRNLNTQSAAITTRLAPSFSAEQLDRLQQKFEKRNQEWREDWMDDSAEERTAYRLKQAVKRAENLYGQIDERQESQIRTHIAVSSFDPKTSYAEILRREHRALQILRAIQRGQLSGSAAQHEIDRFYAQLIDSPDPAYRQYLQTLTQESCHIMAEFHNGTSAWQRQKATDKLQQYIDDLSAVRQPAAP